MKSGTTSLFMDLVKHPHVFFANDKEPHALSSDDVLTEEGRQRYASLYVTAREDQLLMDASTSYSKRPDFEGVAGRATALLPEDFKVIYLVRHPIERIVSQHYHEYSTGLVGPSIDEAVREHRRYVDYSRYAYQLEPWIAAIGKERIRVIRFEDYVSRSQEVLAQLHDFLGLSQVFQSFDESKVYNKSQGKPVRNRFWTAIRDSSFYRKGVRPLLPVKLRLNLQKKFLPKAPQRPDDPLPETLSWLRRELADDVARLGDFLNCDTPLWEGFGKTTSKFCADFSAQSSLK